MPCYKAVENGAEGMEKLRGQPSLIHFSLEICERISQTVHRERAYFRWPYLIRFLTGSGRALGREGEPYSSIFRGRVVPGPGLAGVAARGSTGLQGGRSGTASF